MQNACATHPPACWECIPSRGVALLQGGQRPTSLEYQFYPPSTSIDSLVTGMGETALGKRKIAEARASLWELESEDGGDRARLNTENTSWTNL